MRRLPVIERLIAILDGRKHRRHEIGGEEDVEGLDGLDGVDAVSSGWQLGMWD